MFIFFIRVFTFSTFVIYDYIGDICGKVSLLKIKVAWEFSGISNYSMVCQDE